MHNLNASVTLKKRDLTCFLMKNDFFLKSPTKFRQDLNCAQSRIEVKAAASEDGSRMHFGLHYLLYPQANLPFFSGTHTVEN